MTYRSVAGATKSVMGNLPLALIDLKPPLTSIRFVYPFERKIDVKAIER
jgi:hypothetical protein